MGEGRLSVSGDLMAEEALITTIESEDFSIFNRWKKPLQTLSRRADPMKTVTGGKYG